MSLWNVKKRSHRVYDHYPLERGLDALPWTQITQLALWWHLHGLIFNLDSYSDIHHPRRYGSHGIAVDSRDSFRVPSWSSLDLVVLTYHFSAPVPSTALNCYPHFMGEKQAQRWQTNFPARIWNQVCLTLDTHGRLFSCMKDGHLPPGLRNLSCYGF